jgi:hypothetical protein
MFVAGEFHISNRNMRRFFCQFLKHEARYTSTLVHSDFSSFCRAHRVATDIQLRRDLEVHVWKQCSILQSSDVEKLTVGETVSLMHTLGYFERFWNRGFDGPCEEQISSARPLSAELVSSFVVTKKAHHENSIVQPEVVRPRSSPLDEIFE